MKIAHITEQQVDEALPVAAAWWVIRWIAARGAWPVLRWLLKRHGKKLIVSGAALAAIDQGWDWVIENIGKETAQMLIDNKFEISMAVALVFGAVMIKRFIERQGDRLLASNESLIEVYKQKAGDYAKGNAPMPKKKTRGAHPLGGKLVGETSSGGSTSAGAVASVANPGSMKKNRNKDGTVKNALDIKSNIFGNARKR